MAFAVNLNIVRMNHVQDGAYHLGGRVSAYVLVRGARMEIEMNTEETLIPAKPLLSVHRQATQDYGN